MEIFNWTREVILAQYPAAEISIFGSAATGLELPYSDIDMVVMLPDVKIHSIIRNLEKIFKSRPNVKGNSII